MALSREERVVVVAQAKGPGGFWQVLEVPEARPCLEPAIERAPAEA